MSRRLRLVLLAGLLLPVTAFLGWLLLRPPMVEYVPVVMDRQQHLAPDSTLATPGHLDRLERVLGRYGETYVRLSPTRILIRRQLAADTDLLWNFTSKADDQDWLQANSAQP